MKVHLNAKHIHHIWKVTEITNIIFDLCEEFNCNYCFNYTQ